MEYLLLNNLDAALKDQPKPALFGPSAGEEGCCLEGGEWPGCRPHGPGQAESDVTATWP